jgi:hypothetical protein
MDWLAADPSGNRLRDVCRNRDDIAARLKALCHKMDITLG